MTTACGTVLAYLINKLDDEDKFSANYVISMCTAEKAKDLLLSKDVNQVIDCFSSIFKDIMSQDMIQLIKLALNVKSFNQNKLGKLAFIVYTLYILKELNKFDVMIQTQNEKMEDLLKLSKSVLIMPTNLTEKGSWILNFKRYQKLHQKDKELKIAFEWKKLKQFNEYWYKYLNKQNEVIKYLKFRVSEQNYLKDQNNLLMKLSQSMKQFAQTNREQIYKQKFSRSRRKWLFIQKRKVRQLSKSLMEIQKIEKERRFILDDAKNLENEKKKTELEEVIRQVEEENQNEGINKITNSSREFQDILKLNRKIWDKMNLNELEKRRNEIQLKQDYIIQSIENGQNEYGQNIIEEESSEDEKYEIRHGNDDEVEEEAGIRLRTNEDESTGYDTGQM
jgi:hypothetical protein